MGSWSNYKLDIIDIIAICIPAFGCPDSKIHGANMGPTWVLSAPDVPHIGLINLAIWSNVLHAAPHTKRGLCFAIIR